MIRPFLFFLLGLAALAGLWSARSNKAEWSNAHEQQTSQGYTSKDQPSLSKYEE
jgi:hypothetical protein